MWNISEESPQLQSSLKGHWGLCWDCITAQNLPPPSSVLFTFLPQVLIPRALPNRPSDCYSSTQICFPGNSTCNKGLSLSLLFLAYYRALVLCFGAGWNPLPWLICLLNTRDCAGGGGLTVTASENFTGKQIISNNFFPWQFQSRRQIQQSN